MIDKILDSIFTGIGFLTGFLREMISSFTPDYPTTVILIISLIGGYFLAKRFERLTLWALAGIFALLIFLLLKYV